MPRMREIQRQEVRAANEKAKKRREKEKKKPISLKMFPHHLLKGLSFLGKRIIRVNEERLRNMQIKGLIK